MEPLLIGTSGWTHDGWTGTFYPSNLPQEWRFCYYSNKLRSVLVPHDILAAAPVSEIKQWLQDSDQEFRFVLEAPSQMMLPMPFSALQRELDKFRQSLSLVREQTAGALLRMPGVANVDLDWLEKLLRALTADLPVSVDLSAVPSGQRAEAIAILDSVGAGLCWQARTESAPRPAGRFVVGLANGGAARELRHLVERMAVCGQQGIVSGLFFDGVSAATAAQEARIIAELLGV